MCEDEQAGDTEHVVPREAAGLEQRRDCVKRVREEKGHVVEAEDEDGRLATRPQVRA